MLGLNFFGFIEGYQNKEARTMTHIEGDFILCSGGHNFTVSSQESALSIQKIINLTFNVGIIFCLLIVFHLLEFRFAGQHSDERVKEASMPYCCI